MMNDEVMISITLARYDELLRAEARLQFLSEYAAHETMTYGDIRYYLGVEADEEESDDKD